MPLVRVLTHDREETLALHLRRLGLDARLAAQAVLPRGGWQLLVTGADREALRALPQIPGAPPPILGEADRAPGAALLCGRSDELRVFASSLVERGGGFAELGRRIAQALERQEAHPAALTIGRRRFEWGTRTYLMGVVNVTPDSFSDGGRYADPDAAVAAGERLAAEGVDLIDVGGESTRPGAEPVTAEKELRRVVPVVERLARLVEVPISVDTTKAEVARAAVEAGASFVNDISGLTFDPEMAPTCARLGVAVCAMHIRGAPRTMQLNPTYLDVVGEVMEGLNASLELAERCGLPAERIVVDPGLGFGKTAEHNLFLLRHLAQLKALGRPILVGASRKSFIGKVTGRAVGERLPGSLAVLSAAAFAGADIVRVHDVSESKVAAQLVDAIARARAGGLAFEEG